MSWAIASLSQSLKACWGLSGKWEKSSILKGPFKDGRPRRRVFIDGSESVMLGDRGGYEGKIGNEQRGMGLWDVLEAS